MLGPHETEEFKVLSKENETDVVIRKGRWASLKEDFIDAMMAGRPVGWNELSAKYGFASQTARNKASTMKWYSEIEKRRKAREDLLDAKLTERTHKALDTLNKDFATNEVAIRGRHALMARGMQSKGISEIGRRDLTKASLSDLLRMVELGLREERFAMGLPEVADALPVGDEASSSEFKPIQEQVGGHKNLQKLGLHLLSELRKTNKGKFPSVEDAKVKPAGGNRVFAEPDGRLGSAEASDDNLEDAGLGGLESAVQIDQDAEVLMSSPTARPKITIKHISKES